MSMQGHAQGGPIPLSGESNEKSIMDSRKRDFDG
jgi:hypothetical protein